MMKKKPTRGGGYQKRYLKLVEGRYLCYFEDPTNIAPKGTIDLEESTEIIEKEELEFHIMNAKRGYEFKAESREERNKWSAILKEILNILKKKSKAPEPRVMLMKSHSTSLLASSPLGDKEAFQYINSKDYHRKHYMDNIFNFI